MSSAPVHGTCKTALTVHYRAAAAGHELPYWTCATPGCDATEAWGPVCPGRHPVGLMRLHMGPSLELDDYTVWWCPRCHRHALMGQDPTRPLPPRTAVTRKARKRHAAGELVLRRARHDWICEGKGSPAAHAPDCRVSIVAREQYVEMMWGRLSFFDSHRFTIECASLHWGYDEQGDG